MVSHAFGVVRLKAGVMDIAVVFDGLGVQLNELMVVDLDKDDVIRAVPVLERECFLKTEKPFVVAARLLQVADVVRHVSHANDARFLLRMEVKMNYSWQH
jgi:hypothetical protein